nr:unnamed protein product [Ipomoea batatas]
MLATKKPKPMNQKKNQRQQKQSSSSPRGGHARKISPLSNHVQNSIPPIPTKIAANHIADRPISSQNGSGRGGIQSARRASSLQGIDHVGQTSYGCGVLFSFYARGRRKSNFPPRRCFPMKIISWNCRDIVNGRVRKHVKELLSMHD